jgi:hypothetical protein
LDNKTVEKIITAFVMKIPKPKFNNDKLAGPVGTVHVDETM